MKAILTKVLPCTNTKPTRIKAYAEGGNSLVLSWSECDDAGRNQGEAHLYAASALAKKMNWPVDLIGGGTPEGWCFVFADSNIRSKKVKRCRPIAS
jgi:hypothetical protein